MASCAQYSCLNTFIFQLMNASKEAMWGTEIGMMPSAPLTPSISGQEMGSVEIIRGGGERLSAAGEVRLARHQGEDAEEAGGDGGGEEA